jgi:hypothetical protein
MECVVVATAASRSAMKPSRGAARTACALKWGGEVSGAARQCDGSRRSELTAAAHMRRTQVPARAQSREGRVSEGEREEREREWREKTKVNHLT